MKKSAIIAVLGAFFVAVTGFSQNLFTYEGKLYTAEGVPYSGQAQLTFKIYDVDTGGTPLWEESQVVDVLNGNFSAVLGYSNPLTSVDFSQSPLYIAVEVNNDGEMTPRTLLTDVPGAIKAKYADVVGRDIVSRMICNYWNGGSDPCYNAGAIDTNGNYVPLTDYVPEAYITISNPDSYDAIYIISWVMTVVNKGSNNYKVFRYRTSVDGGGQSRIVNCSWYLPTNQSEACHFTGVIKVPPGTHKVSLLVFTYNNPFQIYTLEVEAVRIK